MLFAFARKIFKKFFQQTASLNFYAFAKTLFCASSEAICVSAGADVLSSASSIWIGVSTNIKIINGDSVKVHPDKITDANAKSETLIRNII